MGEQEVEEPTTFLVAGYMASPAYQTAKFFVQKLHKYFPKRFIAPELRPMLDLEWEEYITKLRRRHGKPFYLLRRRVAVFKDGEFMGDDNAVVDFVSERYSFESQEDFEDLSNKELMQHFSRVIEYERRQFIFMTVAVDKRVIGSMLFQLYSDLVPYTCDNFFGRCTGEFDCYKGTKIHRIAKTSWIQCGGFDLAPRKMPCENYVIPHDRRGVLSMCNRWRHADNSTQFFITLEKTPWMDYKYVAFGQLVQGADVLKTLEQVETYYEAPLQDLEIWACGKYAMCLKEELLERLKIELSLEKLRSPSMDSVAYRDDASVMSERRYARGKYFLKTDLKSYFPFVHLPPELITSWYLEEGVQEGEEAEEMYEEDTEETEDNNKIVGEVVQDILDEVDYNQKFSMLAKKGQFVHTREKSEEMLKLCGE